MKIDDVIENLRRIREEEGNIECTCTGSILPDNHGDKALASIFESTVENFVVGEHPTIGKRVRFFF